MPYECELCDEHKPASFLISPLSGAQTLAVGDECAAVALTGMLASYLGIDADKLYDQITVIVSDAANAPAPEVAPPGHVFKSGVGDKYSTYDLDNGLCGYVHEDGKHCHRKPSHTGRHSKAVPSGAEVDAFLAAEQEAKVSAGGES